jgi:chemotaxis signal transduction protein
MKTNSFTATNGHRVTPAENPRADINQSYLVFEVGSEFYACPITDIERLLRCVDADIEYAAEDDRHSEQVGYLKDTASDAKIQVLSLRAMWNLPRENVSADREALLVVRVANRKVALLVDACLGVLPHLGNERARFYFPAPLLGARGRTFQSAVPWRDSLLVILQVESLLPNEDTASFERLERSLPS